METTFTAANPLQKLNRSDVRLLWYADFWDGPINGLCVCGKKKCWFEMLTEGEEDLPDTTQRRYLVVELSPHQLADAEHWHELFRQKVGTHCDFEESDPQLRPNELQREFYGAYEKRVKPDYSKNPVIGWFEMS